MDKLLTKKEKHSLIKGGGEKENSGQVTTPGFFRDGRPYKMILDTMGHGVHVFRTTSWEILYWNRPAENLYGWKAYEVIGQRVSKVLIAEEYYPLLMKVMEGLSTGQQWSGQYPFKKRSGEIFMAMATQTSFYEDGKMVGIITVSSDATLFNSVASESLRRCKQSKRMEFKLEEYPQATAVAIFTSGSRIFPTYLPFSLKNCSNPLKRPSSEDIICQMTAILQNLNTLSNFLRVTAILTTLSLVFFWSYLLLELGKKRKKKDVSQII